MSRWTLSIACLVLALRATASGPDFQDAVAALQRGDSATAELKLRAELKMYPDEAEAMSLLGTALDNQKKFAEADDMHRQAMAKAMESPGVLNNYGNHLLITGDPKTARDVFLKAAGLDPADDYANLQLGQLALQAGNGQEALQYLNRLSAQRMEQPNMAILRLTALDLAGNRAEADALFNRLAAATENDVALSASLGLKLAQASQFDQAETFLTHALAPDPTNFNLLYQVGVVASRAGHNARAREILEKALLQQPQNVDVLYGLAFVDNRLKQTESALRLLSQAARLAPRRADVQKLLAVATGDLRAFEDSVAAWDRYIALAPDDDTGRRERGFAKANMKQADGGLPDLEWYAGRHPDDPVGLFELAVAQSVDDPEKGLANLDKAVALRPDFADARSARGALNYQQGKADAALPDLEFAAAKLPDSAVVLDRLGQTYLLLDRLPDALRVLRRAAEQAPGDAKTQLHMANALAQAGETAESRTFMNRYRELGGAVAVPARGVMDYLSLTPEQQRAEYRTRLEKGLADHPADAALELSYLKLSIGDGQLDQAVNAAHKLVTMKPGAIILADAGRALMTARQYSLAKDLLEQAETADPTAHLNLDLAMAAFHTDGVAAGIKRLDSVPEPDRAGDYYLSRAQMLEAGGKPDDALAATAMAVKSQPDRPDLYWQAATLMVRNRRAGDALQLLDRAATALPEEWQIPVLKSVVLEISGKTDEAQRVLNDAQHRWPEVAAAWVAQGIILAAHQHFDEASKALETSVSLGAHSPEMFYALAYSSLRAGPEHVDAAESAIARALKLAPDDMPVKTLSERIAARKNADDQAVDPAKLFLARPPQDW